MRYVTVGWLVGIVAGGVAASECARHGTQVEFVDSPREAAALARQREKLVFVLHVSGHFEDPRFT